MVPAKKKRKKNVLEAFAYVILDDDDSTVRYDSMFAHCLHTVNKDKRKKKPFALTLFRLLGLE